MSDDIDSKVVPIREGLLVKTLGDYASKSFGETDQSSGGGEWNSEINAFLEAETLKSLMYNEDWVFICVNLIAGKIATQPLNVVERERSTSGVVTEKIIFDHKLKAIIDHPNDSQDYHEWMYICASELTLMGNSMQWYAPASNQIMTLPTERMTIQTNPDSCALEGYVLNDFRTDDFCVDAKAMFPVEQIGHIRMPNPGSLLYGLSPFIPGRKSILFNRYSQDYLNAFYQRQALPGMTLELERQVNEDIALRQLRSFESAYQGRKNQRRTLILPKGVKANAITHSLGEQRLLDYIGNNRETILALLNIPKHELSLQTAGSLGSEEHKISLRNFWEASLLPRMCFIEGTLNKLFRDQLGPNQFFKFDISNVQALRDSMLAQADVAKRMLEGGKSINEVRTSVWNVPAFEDDKRADKPYPLITTVTVNSAMDELATEAANNEGQEPSEEAVETDVSEEKILLPQRALAIRASMAKGLDDEEARRITQLSKVTIDLLVKFTERAAHVITKSDKKFVAKELPKNSVLNRRIRRALDEFEESWIEDNIALLFPSITFGYDQVVDTLEAPASIINEILQDRDSGEAARTDELEKRSQFSFDSIASTHTDRIIALVDKKRGDSATDIIAAIVAALGTAAELAGKADTIARTETLTAVSIGQGSAAKDIGKAVPGSRKMWVTVGDDRVRDTHESLEGSVVDIDQKFGNGLSYPRDPKVFNPSETINCRCNLLIVPPKGAS